MSLNIENDEIRRLAGELASLTGETIPEAVTVALKERLERERRKHSGEEGLQGMRAISQRTARMLRDGPSAVEQTILE